MKEQRKFDTEYTGGRGVGRVVGSIVGVVGLLFVVVGLVIFLSKISEKELPWYVWCFAIGVPLLVVGGLISMAAGKKPQQQDNTDGAGSRDKPEV